MKECAGCGREFTGRNKKATFCSPRCRSETLRRKYAAMNGNSGRLKLKNGTIGAIHELVVCADMMTKGWDVFRCVSPSSPVDLALLRDGKLLLIEVTTGCRGVSGKLQYPAHKKYSHVFDVIAVVEKGGKITYIPDICSD